MEAELRDTKQQLVVLNDEVVSLRLELAEVKSQRNLYLQQRDQARQCLLVNHRHHETTLASLFGGCTAPSLLNPLPETSTTTTANPLAGTVQPTEAHTQKSSADVSVASTSQSQRTVAVRKPSMSPEGAMYRHLEACVKECGLDPKPLIRFPNDTRRPKVLEQKWLDVDIPTDTDLLILSDSVFRSVDVSSVLPNSALLAFGGMSVGDLLAILFKAVASGVHTKRLVLCAGVNDIFAGCASYALDDLGHVLTVAKRVSPEVVLCTAYKAGWKVKKSHGRKALSEGCLDQGRLTYNTGLKQLAAAQDVTVLDLEQIFSHRTGRVPGIPGWYLKDAVHPNVNGSAAIEICLRQVINCDEVIPPKTADEHLFHRCSAETLHEEQNRRRSLQQENCPNLWRRSVAQKRRNVEDVVVTVDSNRNREEHDTWDIKRRRCT